MIGRDGLLWVGTDEVKQLIQQFGMGQFFTVGLSPEFPTDFQFGNLENGVIEDKVPGALMPEV